MRSEESSQIPYYFFNSCGVLAKVLKKNQSTLNTWIFFAQTLALLHHIQYKLEKRKQNRHINRNKKGLRIGILNITNYIWCMKIKIYNPKELNRKYRLSVHRTGKIGFPIDAADKLKLVDNKSVDFGSNEEDANDTNLYMIVHKDRETGGFKVNKNGDYYSINIKILLDNLQLDYTSGKVWFEMEEKMIGDDKVYKLEKKGVSTAQTLDNSTE